MNVMKVWSFILILLLVSCGEKEINRWEINAPQLKESIYIEDVSKSYYDLSVSNQQLKKEFPDFFEAVHDSVLNRRRQDSISNVLNKNVNQVFKEKTQIQDSLKDIFQRISYFYPGFTVPKVYTFTGELAYEHPIAFFPESHDMVIGLDWFLGDDNKLYSALGVPDYFRTQMNSGNLKPKVVESMAKQMVPFDIRKRKFIDRMVYQGKQLIIQDALLPNVSDSRKIGYTQDEINWAKTNEATIYKYFVEEGLFFSDDKTLDERFLNPAPFSKFFSENDTKSPGKIAAWLGWQICRAYLEKNKDLSLQAFLLEEDAQKIFTESGYKPVD